MKTDIFTFFCRLWPMLVIWRPVFDNDKVPTTIMLMMMMMMMTALQNLRKVFLLSSCSKQAFPLLSSHTHPPTWKEYSSVLHCNTHPYELKTEPHPPCNAKIESIENYNTYPLGMNMFQYLQSSITLTITIYKKSDNQLTLPSYWRYIPGLQDLQNVQFVHISTSSVSTN